MNLNTILLFLIANTIVNSKLYCQSDSTRIIRGIVYASTQNDPLIGATIILKGNNLGTVTDLNGKFEISVPRKGKYILEVSYTGKQKYVKIRKNKNYYEIDIDKAPSSISVKLESGISNLEFNERKKNTLLNTGLEYKFNSRKWYCFKVEAFYGVILHNTDEVILSNFGLGVNMTFEHLLTFLEIGTNFNFILSDNIEPIIYGTNYETYYARIGMKLSERLNLKFALNFSTIDIDVLAQNNNFWSYTLMAAYKIK